MIKFQDSSIDDNKVSHTTIRFKNKDYTGIARLHPDDEFSKFTGCRIAEYRATISALKEEYRIEKAKYDECKKFVKAVEQYKKFNSEDPSAKAMYRQLNRRAKKLTELKEWIEDEENLLSTTIQNIGIIKKYRKDKTD